MNDPAVLFYTSDFLTGVIDMTMEERGQYITLLCYQHQKGHMKEETIRLLVGSVSDNVLSHFIKDENNLFFNKRMDEEKEKRNKFTESRRNNGLKGGRPLKDKKPSAKPLGYAKNNLMGNENENENINDNINEIINYLNYKINSNYKTNSKNTKSHISARLKEGYTFEDFKKVIDIKYADWHNTEYEKFLRPDTLFGTKFENYLNQPIRK